MYLVIPFLIFRVQFLVSQTKIHFTNFKFNNETWKLDLAICFSYLKELQKTAAMNKPGTPG